MPEKARIVLVGVLVFAGTIAVFIALVLNSTDKGGLTAGFTAEFLDRPDGYKGLQEAYGLRFPSGPGQMDPGLMYRACSEGSVDVICGFATDGRIAAYDLVTLEDDMHFFPPYQAVPLVRADAIADHPELEDLLNNLAGTLDDAAMRDLNLQVDRKENPRRSRDVARDFLVTSGLIASNAAPGNGSAGLLRIGGKDFTEQDILGEIIAILIECNTDIRVERRLYLGGTMVCFNALRAGDLDFYAEYTGTGLVNILDKESMADPAQALATVRQDFRQNWDLLWLEPFGFNNTYTITMRRSQAEELGLTTISELAAHLRDEEQARE